jgi:hypothetical protein
MSITEQIGLDQRNGEVVRVGDTVIVYSGNHSRRMQADRYTVIKVAKVWITVRYEGKEESGAAWDRRFRLDDHTDGAEVAPSRFYTLTQWAKREREVEADAFLKEQGITLEYASPWRKRRAELADLIRAGLGPAGPETAA